MAHPQNSARGYFAKKRIDIQNSTGKIMYNSTVGGPIFSGAIAISGQATFGLLSANSTAMILPNSVRVGTKTTYFSSNSTGVKLGTRYISTNTTGNTST